MKNILTFLFAAVLCLSQLAGAPPDQSIVGIWKADDALVQFTADGKVTVTFSSRAINGTYALLDGGHFKISLDLDGKKKEQTVAYTISDDALTTTDADGKKETLTRVK